MAKKFINRTKIEGYVYEHKLEKKVTGETSKVPGTEFITGTLSVATDEALTNVVPVHFTYVTATTNKGGANATFNVLSNIVSGAVGTVMANGKDKAGKVSIDSAIGLNEFYSSRNGAEELVSAKRNEGGFVTLVQTLGDEAGRATFNVDMLINGFTRTEANPEHETPEKGTIKGCVFDFRGAILPVEFSVFKPQAIDYFEDLQISTKNPAFARVTGQQVSKTIVRKIEETSAWGEVSVKEIRNSQKDFVVDWAQEPYEWDSESTLLASELTEKIANREVYLADMKRRQDEFQNNRNNTPASVASKSTAYNF